ncbi:hypothetical protein AGOR_G00094710 [Albula goreensis]|uniref:ADP-ribosylation factor-like protein 5C n=1 Tax=Albula goreensis TaxID=1534307 RepID=A0A8T3DG19_9TELE|nr:hypothetical protein AGOR_G00094710 [Albula goreensis]
MGLLFAKLMTVFGDRGIGMYQFPWSSLFLFTSMLFLFRAQGHHRWPGQCREDHHPLPILFHLHSLTKEAMHTSPTIGSNVEEIAVRKTRFLVWDIGGQESLRASWNSYYCNTEVSSVPPHTLLSGSQLCSACIVILVVDSTDRERLTLTREELHRMLAHEDLQNAAVLVLANKQDMKDSMSAAEISHCLTLSSITGHSWHIQACCALTGKGSVPAEQSPLSSPPELQWTLEHSELPAQPSGQAWFSTEERLREGLIGFPLCPSSGMMAKSVCLSASLTSLCGPHPQQWTVV